MFKIEKTELPTIPVSVLYLFVFGKVIKVSRSTLKAKN